MHNVKKKLLLQMQEEQLQTAKSDLTRANEQIKKLQALNVQTQNLLQKVNQCLKALEKEKLRNKKRLKLQHDIVVILFAFTVGHAIAKINFTLNFLQGLKYIKCKAKS